MTAIATPTENEEVYAHRCVGNPDADKVPGDEKIAHALFDPESVKLVDNVINFLGKAVDFKLLFKPCDNSRDGLSCYRINLPHGRQLGQCVKKLKKIKLSQRDVVYLSIITASQVAAIDTGIQNCNFTVIPDPLEDNKTHALFVTEPPVTSFIRNDVGAISAIEWNGVKIPRMEMLRIRQSVIDVMEINTYEFIYTINSKIIEDSCEGPCENNCPQLDEDFVQHFNT